MMISDTIQQVVASTFPAGDQADVLDVLTEIGWPPNAPSEESLQAAVLVLGFRNREGTSDLAALAWGDARDVLRLLEFPHEYQPELTRAELVRRYRVLGLPVPAVLAAEV